MDVRPNRLSDLTDAELDDVIAFSNRFRRVANRYPLQVTYAYGGNVARAMADSDDHVAATVATWEQAQGLTPRDWAAHGRTERAG